MSDAVKKDYLSFDKAHIWHPFSPLVSDREVLCVERAQGAYLYTETGRRLIDGISSWWVSIHGHAHPRLARALYEQALQLEHVIFAGCTHPPALNLSQRLLDALPHPYARLFFSDNGSTAVEVALKMAIQYYANKKSPREQIISIEGGYHGDTFGAMSLGGKSLFTSPFEQHMFEVLQVPFPSPERGEEALRLLRKALRTPTAAFVFEPLIQGAGGMRVYAAEWLDRAIKICRSEDVLCVADEVFTGFGRTGRCFATSYLGEAPDLVALSKGLTGGMMPMGLTVANAAVSQAFESTAVEKTFFHGHSYTANPLACRVAVESLKMLLESETQQSIQSLTKQQTAFVSTLKHHRVADARSLGTVAALTLKTMHQTGYDNPIRDQIYDFFLERDVLLRPLGNVIYIVPPYVMSAEDLGYVHSAILDLLEQLK